jgi:hypothetical protein
MIVAGAIIVYGAAVVGACAAAAALMDTRNLGPLYVIAGCLAAVAIGGMMGAR